MIHRYIFSYLFAIARLTSIAVIPANAAFPDGRPRLPTEILFPSYTDTPLLMAVSCTVHREDMYLENARLAAS
jgi:hypothetical protein